MMTPDTVPHGRDRQLNKERGIVLMAAAPGVPQELRTDKESVPKPARVNPAIEEIAMPAIFISRSDTTSSRESPLH